MAAQLEESRLEPWIATSAPPIHPPRAAPGRVSTIILSYYHSKIYGIHINWYTLTKGEEEFNPVWLLRGHIMFLKLPLVWIK